MIYGVFVFLTHNTTIKRRRLTRSCVERARRLDYARETPSPRIFIDAAQHRCSEGPSAPGYTGLPSQSAHSPPNTYFDCSRRTNGDCCPGNKDRLRLEHNYPEFFGAAADGGTRTPLKKCRFLSFRKSCLHFRRSWCPWCACRRVGRIRYRVVEGKVRSRAGNQTSARKSYCCRALAVAAGHTAKVFNAVPAPRHAVQRP